MLKPPPSKEPFNFSIQFEGVLANNKLSNRACKRDIVKKRERAQKPPQFNRFIAEKLLFARLGQKRAKVIRKHAIL